VVLIWHRLRRKPKLLPAAWTGPEELAGAPVARSQKPLRGPVRERWGQALCLLVSVMLMAGGFMYYRTITRAVPDPLQSDPVGNVYLAVDRPDVRAELETDIVSGFHGDDVSLRPLFDLRAGENVTWAIYSDGYLPMYDGTGKYSTWPQVPGLKFERKPAVEYEYCPPKTGKTYRYPDPISQFFSTPACGFPAAWLGRDALISGVVEGPAAIEGPGGGLPQGQMAPLDVAYELGAAGSDGYSVTLPSFRTIAMRLTRAGGAAEYYPTTDFRVLVDRRPAVYQLLQFATPQAEQRSSAITWSGPSGLEPRYTILDVEKQARHRDGIFFVGVVLSLAGSLAITAGAGFNDVRKRRRSREGWQTPALG
jgi:hypothetical protein